MKKTAIYNFLPALIALAGFIAVGTVFAEDAVLKDIAETEITISELKLKQLVQKIGWSEQKSAEVEEDLMKSPFYLKSRDEFFSISRQAAESKRRLELAEASAGRVDPQMEQRVLELELELKKAALRMENAKLEHYLLSLIHISEPTRPY